MQKEVLFWQVTDKMHYNGFFIARESLYPAIMEVFVNVRFVTEIVDIGSLWARIAAAVVAVPLFRRIW